MIEAYAFLAAFAVLVLLGSVLAPSALIRYVRGWAINFGSERFAQLYPGFDYGRWVERFAVGYRAVTLVIAAFGAALLAWQFNSVRVSGWNAGQAESLPWMYFMLQMAPLALLSLYVVVRYRKALLQPSQEVKRTATLQRRGLFDFISPFAVWFAVASYFLFVAFGIYLDLFVYDNATLSRACLIAIGGVTFIYAINAFIIYKSLYGRKNPYLSKEGRAHTMGARVKGGVYGCIAVAWFISIFGTLGQPGLQQWRPFSLCVFCVITTFISFLDVSSPPRKPDEKELRSNEVAS